MSERGPSPVRLDGDSLTLSELVRVARDPRVPVTSAPTALARLERSWRLVERIAESYRHEYPRFLAGERPNPPISDYGVSTGFGEFKNEPIAADELETLQRHILLSHSAGVGHSCDPDDLTNYFPAEVVRATLVIRLNAFLKGHSGISPGMYRAVAALLDRGIVPLVPVKGSVGSSGDLCPLAHLFAIFLGHGRYAVVRRPEEMPSHRWRVQPATELAGDLGFEPPAPGPKEGLALVNGATLSTALLALALADAAALANAADVAVALALEAVGGCARAFDPKIHRARGMSGQMASAANVRELVAGSRFLDRSEEVQDAYSLRCAPAVHGASRDALAYARMVAEREINAATDNPLFFPGEDGALHADEPWDHRFRANWPKGYRGERRASYSAGNFHGQPIALAADFLAIAVAELADISERRTQMLLDDHHNRNLPANLIPRRGVNSGFMLAQYTAAALVSENKVLAHPASVDSIPTSANSEDHVAMATGAAQKLRTVVANAQAVLAIELLVAAQAVEWRVGMERPVRSRPPAPRRPSLAAQDEEIREAWRESRQAAAREAEAFGAATAAARRPAIAGQLGAGSGAAYLAVRRVAEPLLEDRPLDEDIRRVRRLLQEGTLLAAVGERLSSPLAGVAALATREDG